MAVGSMQLQSACALLQQHGAVQVVCSAFKSSAFACSGLCGWPSWALLGRLLHGWLLLQASRLDQVAGLLVDLKLLQLDCLEALAAQLAQQPAAGAAAAGAQPAAGKKQAAGSSGSSSGPGGGDEVQVLLGEAEALAAELFKE
jgi:hypothetical protein